MTGSDGRRAALAFVPSRDRDRECPNPSLRDDHPNLCRSVRPAAHTPVEADVLLVLENARDGHTFQPPVGMDAENEAKKPVGQEELDMGVANTGTVCVALTTYAPVPRRRRNSKVPEVQFRTLKPARSPSCLDTRFGANVLEPKPVRT